MYALEPRGIRAFRDLPATAHESLVGESASWIHRWAPLFYVDVAVLQPIAKPLRTADVEYVYQHFQCDEAVVTYRFAGVQAGFLQSEGAT